MNPPNENNATDVDDRTLDPGVIVTVAAGTDWIDAPPGRLFVVIDGFKAPLYLIAVLGGDGYQYPNTPRQLLTVVTPTRIVLDDQADPPGYLCT